MKLPPPNSRLSCPWSRSVSSMVCLWGMVVTGGIASAQSMFGQQSTASNGLSGGSTMSSSSSGFGGATGSGFGGSSGSTGQTLGAGGFGSSSSTAGRTGTTGGSQLNAQFGQQQAQQRQFVGVDSGDSIGSLFGAAGQGNSRGQQNSNLRSGNNQRRFQADQQQATKVPIRTHLNIRFARTAIAPELVSSKLQTSLNRLQRPLATATTKRSTARTSVGLESVQPTVEGRTVTLRGTVPNEDAKRLAVRVAKLEPGISQVVDELTVAP